MSRTEHFSLPRIPTAHARITSPGALTHHAARTMRSQSNENYSNRSSEPSYTAYLGTPRQDVPNHVYKDPAMYDDVFDKKGNFAKRTTPKFSSPLDTQEYNSLHDPHCKRLFLNNKWLREHLTELGLITQDHKVVASTREQRETIRAHELLERKEQLAQRLEDQEQQRLLKMSRKSKVPSTVQWSLEREVARKQAAEERKRRIQESKMAELKAAKEVEMEKNTAHKTKWKKFVEDYELNQQRQRNAEEIVRKEHDMLTYVNRYGTSPIGLQLAGWHRDSEMIAEKMRRMDLKRRKNKIEERHQQELSSVLKDASGEDLGYLKKIREARLKEEEIESDQKEHESVRDVEDAQEDVVPQSGQDRMMEPTVASPVEKRESDSKSERQEMEVKTRTDDVIEEALTSVLGEDFQPSSEQKDRDGTPPVGREVETALDGKEDGHTEQSPSQPKDDTKESVHITPDVEYVSPSQPTEEESVQLISDFMIHMSASYDHNQMGYIDSGTFRQLLSSRETGLKLTEDETYQVLQFIDPDSSQWVPYYEASTVMREVLLAVFGARPDDMKPPSAADEEAWRQMYTPSFGMLYYNVVDGRAQRHRPSVFRPYLEDEVFEDTIVDFFETADTNKDKFIDEDEFRELLFSPTVKDQLYEEQKEDLIGLFVSSATNGNMTLEEFVPLARTMVTMVYRRHYEGQTSNQWLELNSTKYGQFWLNKDTGETMFPQTSEYNEQTSMNASLRASTVPDQIFGTVESLPNVGDFNRPVASRPITYPYQIHTASGMGHDVITPPTDDYSGQQRKKKLKRKQRSNASTREGKRPPALRRRSQTSSAPAVHEEEKEKNNSSQNDQTTDVTNLSADDSR